MDKNSALAFGDIIIEKGQNLIDFLKTQPFTTLPMKKELTFCEDRIFRYIPQDKATIEKIKETNKQRQEEMSVFIKYVASFVRDCKTPKLAEQYKEHILKMREALSTIIVHASIDGFDKIVFDGLNVLAKIPTNTTNITIMKNALENLARQYGQHGVSSGEDMRTKLFALIQKAKQGEFGEELINIDEASMIKIYNTSPIVLNHENISLQILASDFTNAPCKPATLEDWDAYQASALRAK